MSVNGSPFVSGAKRLCVI